LAMTRIAEIPSCFCCPWVYWDESEMPYCHNPADVDRKIKDVMSIPSFCPLDELLEIE
jgi:hypothetical protein